MSLIVAHHYGLFDFNTVEPDAIDARAALEADAQLAMHRAQPGRALRLTG